MVINTLVVCWCDYVGILRLKRMAVWNWGFSHMWWITGVFENWVRYFGVLVTPHNREENPLFKSKNRLH